MSRDIPQAALYESITAKQAAYLAVLIHRVRKPTCLKIKKRLGLTDTILQLSKQDASALISELKEVAG